MMRNLLLMVAFVVASCFCATQAHADVVAQWTFNEGSGSVAGDSVGNSDADVLWGSALTTTDVGGESNGVAEFSATNQSVRVAAPASDLAFPSSDGAISLEIWIKPTSGGGTDQSLLGRTINSFALTYNSSDDTGGMIFWQAGNSGQRVGRWRNVGSWYHVVATFDTTVASGNNAFLYIDGVEVNATRWTDMNLDGGAGPFDIGMGFVGQINEARVYNHALDQTEVTASYTAGPVIPEPATLGLLSMGSVALLLRKVRN